MSLSRHVHIIINRKIQSKSFGAMIDSSTLYQVQHSSFSLCSKEALNSLSKNSPTFLNNYKAVLTVLYYFINVNVSLLPKNSTHMQSLMIINTYLSYYLVTLISTFYLTLLISTLSRHIMREI